jgi:ATP-dependent protease HslVU (ClpYQ) peptidase subunit
MIEVVKQKREGTPSLLKRFSRKVKQSGNILRFKKNQFKERKKSDLKKKREALMKVKKIEKLSKLYKLGKFPNNPLKNK